MTNKNNDVRPDEGNEECPDDDGVVPENQSIATTAMVCNTNQAAAITKINNIIKVIRIKMITNLFITLNLQKILHLYRVAHIANRKRFLEKKRLGNNIRDRATVINFIHSWMDTMFKQQFRRKRADFWVLHNTIMDHKVQNGYNKERQC
jgi:hypothetical protein